MKLTVVFELLDPRSADWLGRGHMTINSNGKVITSKYVEADQSMMIFLSIGDLLDGVRRCCMDKTAREFNFVGADCSFQLSFLRLGTDQIEIRGSRCNLGKFNVCEVTSAINQGVTSFLKSNAHLVKPGDPVFNDLEKSVADFEGVLECTWKCGVHQWWRNTPGMMR